MQDLGYDPATTPMTWDDFMALGEKAKAKGIYLENTTLTDWSEWLHTVHQAGGTVVQYGQGNHEHDQAALHRCPESLGQAV